MLDLFFGVGLVKAKLSPKRQNSGGSIIPEEWAGQKAYTEHDTVIKVSTVNALQSESAFRWSQRITLQLSIVKRLALSSPDEALNECSYE